MPFDKLKVPTDIPWELDIRHEGINITVEGDRYMVIASISNIWQGESAEVLAYQIVNYHNSKLRRTNDV